MSATDAWLLLFSLLLLLVLVFAASKARRLRRMPLYFPAFACLCGGLLLALLERLKRDGALDAPLRHLAPSLPTGGSAAGLLLTLQLASALLLLYVLVQWLRGARE